MQSSDPQMQDYVEVLFEFARLVGSSLDHHEMLRHCLLQLKRVLVFDSASIYLIPRNSASEFVAGIGFKDEKVTTREGERLLPQSPVLAQMVEDQQPVISGDVRQLEGWIWVPGAEHVRSFMAVPLLVQDVVIGALMLDSVQVDFFHSSVLPLVETLARQLAISIENARLFAAKQKQLKLANTLRRVGALLTTRIGLNVVYQQIFDLLGEVIAYDSVSVQLLGNDQDRLIMASARGFPDEQGTRQFTRQNTAALLARFSGGRRVIVIPDTHAEEQWTITPPVAYIRSWIGAVLQIKGRMIGVLNVDSATVGAFDVEAGETVAAFANQAAVAIENARLHEETRQRAQEQAILHQVALATAVTMDVDELLLETTEAIVTTLYPDVFGFLLIDEENQSLVPHDSYYGISEEYRGYSIPIEESVVGLVTKTGMPIIVSNTAEEPHYFMAVPSTRSEIAVPLMVHKHVIGVINAESPLPDAFSERDAHFLETLAAQMSAAIERAKLYDALKQRADSLARDVAERAAELRQERDRTLAILESAGEGIYLTDSNARILYANPALERQSGYARNELLEKDFRILASDQVPPSAFEDIWKTVYGGHRWSGEMVNQRKDGTYYDVSLTIQPIIDPDNKVNGFVSVQADIGRLKELDRLKSQFVTNVSHELRTPLTNIKTYLTLLDRGKPERREMYLKVLNHETDRLARLIDDLLDLSRLDAETIQTAGAASDLTEMVREHYQLFAPMADEKQMLFELDVPAQLPRVRITPEHLSQLLHNLLGNAFAYTPAGGHIRLSAGAKVHLGQTMLWFCVKDNGPGISAEDKKRLYTRFFRGQAAAESGAPGTGLGLAICREIVERYQGRIELESQLGQGASFTVWLEPTASEE